MASRKETRPGPVKPAGVSLAGAAVPAPASIDHARLVLVSAPAGFGKTTVLCQYERALREGGVPTGWLTVDADDNDLARFAAYLRAALARCMPGIVAEGRAPAGGTALGDAYEVVDSIAGSEAPFALFIDDFEKLGD